MAEANNAMCNYLSVPEIFADYWNGAVFGGVQKNPSRGFGIV